MPNGRRRRRRSTASPAGASPAAAPVSSPPEPQRPAAVPSPPLPRSPDRAGPDAGEQVWERTHLEQMMFALARDRAEAAARSANASPPDRAAEQTNSLVSILMSFLALEAFINMVGGDRLSTRYRHYDRMSLEGKWLEVTRLATKQGKTFDEDGEEMRALATLRSWRNLLTHYKGEYEEVQPANRGGETRIEALLSAENAARALEIARSLYRAFYTWDRRSPPRQFIWLDDRPHRSQAPPASRQPESVPPAAPPVSPASRPTSGAGAAPRRGRRRRRR